MGQKFASLHIRTNNVNDVINALNTLKKKPKSKDNTDKFTKFINIIDKPTETLDNEKVEMIKGLFSMIDEFSNTFFIIEYQNNWISIYSESFNWEDIDKKGIKVSKSINCPILSVGYFDDDILKLDIIKDGKVITRHYEGDNIESCFGIKNITADFDLIIETFNLNFNLEDFKGIIMNRDLETKVEKLEHILNIGFVIDDYDIEVLEKEIPLPVYKVTL